MPKCPECASRRIWKDGLRQNSSGYYVQRWLCRDCGFRFSHPPLKKDSKWRISRASGIDSTCQIGASRQAHGLVENLVTVEPLREGPAGATQQTIDAKGKIVEYSFWMLKQGYVKSTIQGRTKLLKRLTKLGANLHDSESIKETIARQGWSAGRKTNAADAYTSFLHMQGLKWEPPIFNRIRKLPFIPTENELDQLISGCNKRMAAFLQLLKETGVRCGEACQTKWSDLDTVNHSVRVTPEKGSNARNLRLSNKLISMLNELAKASINVYGANADAMRKSYQLQRRRISSKLKNPRLLRISFHTFRHWKATMEYHKTKDILHVMRILGHRSIQNTLVYTQLIDFQDEEFTSKVASNEQDICKLIESGFDYICDFEGKKFFRKRK
jgi:integrase